MSVKLICHRANEKSRIESDVTELEKDGYTFDTVIPIFSNPKFADLCIILKK